MSQYTEAERELGMDMLEAAEGLFVELGAPSRLGVALFSACVGSIGVESGTSEWGALSGAMLMGYACRMTQDERKLPDDLTEAIEAQLIRAADGRLDNEAISQEWDRLERLVAIVAAIGDGGEAVAAIADTSPGTWEAFCTTATYQLHKNLLGNGMPKRALPPADLLGSLLRLGYAIRLVDEIAGEAPADREGQPIDDSQRDRPFQAGTALDIEQWISDATSVCAHAFEPQAERVLELGALATVGAISVPEYLLGEPLGEPIPNDADIAVSNARFGYALRNRECQLISGAGDVEDDDPLAAQLDSREHGAAPAVLDRLIRDVLDLSLFGGAEAVYDWTPGTTPTVRRAAIQGWAGQHYPGPHPRTGQEVTRHLVEYGYLLHRLFELRPRYLDSE